MKRTRIRKARRLAWLVLAGVLLQAPVGVGTAAEGELELEIAEYPAENYEPGPGWPEGWTPPPPPEGMSERMRAEVEQILRDYPHMYQEYDWWVWDPLPAWTQEYPWFWREDKMGCGTTLHIYAYPAPDTQLIYKVFGRSFGWSRLYWKPCRYEPIQSITETRELSEEEKLAEGRGIEYEYWMDKSHPGLGRDYGYRHNGNPDEVFVFFNFGNASSHFDTPAYLDTTVNRVRVPIRFVSEMMGGQVAWDEARRRVTIRFPAVSREVTKAVPAAGYDFPDLIHPETHLPDPYRYVLEKQTVSTPERTIVLTIDRPVAVVDGREVALDAPPVIRNGRTMVPVRFIAEQMGAKVYWVGAEPIFRLDDGTMSGTYQVHIFTPFFPLYEYPSWYLENRAVRY